MIKSYHLCLFQNYSQPNVLFWYETATNFSYAHSIVIYETSIPKDIFNFPNKMKINHYLNLISDSSDSLAMFHFVISLFQDDLVEIDVQSALKWF
jgi:hypothetical protein